MFYDSNEVDTNVVFPHGCPSGCLLYPFKYLLEVNEHMVDILVVLQVLSTKDSKVEYLLCSSVSCPIAGVFFSVDILRLWLEPV